MTQENKHPDPMEAEIAHFREHIREQIHVMMDFGYINSEQEVYADLHVDDIARAYITRMNEWEEEYGTNLPLSVEMEILHGEIRKAVQHTKEGLASEPPLYETALFRAAVSHFSHDVDHNIENDHVRAHAAELICCYENKKSLIDFDFWTQYETLLDEKLTWDEYIALDGMYEDDPLDIDPSDHMIIAALKADLESYRQKPKPLETRIMEASKMSGQMAGPQNTKEQEPTWTP